MSNKFKRAAAAVCAAGLALCCVTGCAKSDDSSSSSGKSGKSDNSASGDTKVDIYLDEDGSPYYVDPDGSKMMLFASPYDTDDEDYSESYIYDKYDSNGLKFDIPDGWYADDSYGSPTLFIDGEEDNFDEYISVVPSMYVLDPDSDGNYDTESAIKAYYDEAVAEGYYLSYEITDKGDEKVNGIDAKYYLLTASSDSFYYDEEESEEPEVITIRIKYVITGGDNSHTIILTSLDSDESYKKVDDAYKASIAVSLELPTAEQMAEAEELLDDEEYYFDDEEFDDEEFGDIDTVLS